MDNTTWFDGAAFDIFIADGGVDDFDSLTPMELKGIIARVLPDYVDMILAAALKLQGDPTWGGRLS